MSTANGYYPYDNSTLANFQAWSSAIYNAFISFGWAQTADSGQADNPIAAVPSGAWPYWIFKSTDALSSTLPIYIKVACGFNSTQPQIQITVGTGSDGSGIIIGITISNAPWTITTFNYNEGSIPYPCFFSGDSSSFRMYLWQSINLTIGVVFGVERSLNSSGANTASFITVLCANTYSQSQIFQQSLTSSLPGNREMGIIGLALTNGSNTGYWNGSVASLPVFPILGQCMSPMLGWQMCAANDVTDGSTVTVSSFYGQTHTMVAANKPNLGAAAGQRWWNPTPMALLMRYE
jgi:hypothetical protein